MSKSIDKITTMFSLQKSLNDQTNGQGWEKGVAKNGKSINWNRCSILELSELIESLPYKHWKNINATGDYKNVKIETVDTWHFIMSEILSSKNEPISEKSLKSLIERLSESESFNRAVYSKYSSHPDTEAEIQKVEKLMLALMTNAAPIELLELFMEIVPQSELNIDELYTLYIGKNILNTHRQENGYATGEYIKTWGDVEDNVVMQKILDENPDITPGQLKITLQNEYDTIVENQNPAPAAP